MNPSDVPAVVADIAGDTPIELTWKNEIGGSTFRIGNRYVKWNPLESGVDLTLERDRMRWLASRHPAPTVLEFDSDSVAQWLVTQALPGSYAVGDYWRARPTAAIATIAAGLKAIHNVPTDEFPESWTSWANITLPELGEPPPLDEPVLVHGDACAPNTLISESGDWVGHVDLGDLTVGDRWADLAIAALSLDWNFGDGHQNELYDAYGIEPDHERIEYYRALWEIAS